MDVPGKVNWQDLETSHDFLEQSRTEFIAKYPACTKSSYRNRASTIGMTIPDHEHLIADRRRSGIAARPYEYRPIFRNAVLDPVSDGSNPPLTLDLAPGGNVGADPDLIWQAILKSGKGGATVEHLADRFSVPPRDVRSAVGILRDVHGKALAITPSGEIHVGYDRNERRDISVPQADETIRFAVVSDTHLGATNEALDELHAFYRIAEQEGYTVFVHAGDLDHGIRVYPGQEHESFFSDLERRIDHVVRDYPIAQGATTVFIGGNHDESWTNKAQGIDFGRHVARERRDLAYLGLYQGRVLLGDPDAPLAIHLQHGYNANWGRVTANIVDRFAQDDRPHYMFCGHWHQAHTQTYKGVRVVLPGCFERGGSGLLRKLNITDITIGGWLFDVEMREGQILRETPRWIDLSHMYSQRRTFVVPIPNGSTWRVAAGEAA